MCQKGDIASSTLRTQILGAMVQNLATWMTCSVLVLTLNAIIKGMCLLFFIDSKKTK